MSNYAIDNAARFGEIPFVDFSKELVTGIFDSLVEAHVLQMEEYAEFVGSLTQDLSTYINNTVDGVSFEQIADFVTNYELPTPPENDLLTALNNLADPSEVASSPTVTDPTGTADASTAADSSEWWGALLNTLGPAVSDLVDKIDDPSESLKYQAITDYNQDVLNGVAMIDRTIPNYGAIHSAVASLIASNKYSLLQTMAKQGVMRLVVTEGEIETKITFSTWNSSTSGSEQSYSQKTTAKVREKTSKGGGYLFFYKNKRKRRQKNRTVTVNTAKSYQRDSSGTSVNIFGRVLIRFKTDYAPLNG